MREQLIQYVQLLFAGTSDTDEIQQEILQNTLDKYDDLIRQGKSPESAYRLAISGIGDINEILTTDSPALPIPATEPANNKSKLLRSIAVALYILCPVPLFLFGNAIGLCGLLLMVAFATGIMVYIKKEIVADVQSPAEKPSTPENPSRRIARGIIWGGGICLYVSVSMITGAWWITWLIFPMLSAIQNLVNAIFDLREETENEK